MGEDLYHCAPPTGYADRAELWVNPGALVSRINFVLEMLSGKVQGTTVAMPQLERASYNTRDAATKIADQIHHLVLSPNTLNVILKEFKDQDILLGKGEVRPSALSKIAGLVLGSPEFQRR